MIFTERERERKREYLGGIKDGKRLEVVERVGNCRDEFGGGLHYGKRVAAIGAGGGANGAGETTARRVFGKERRRSRVPTAEFLSSKSNTHAVLACHYALS